MGVLGQTIAPCPTSKAPPVTLTLAAMSLSTQATDQCRGKSTPTDLPPTSAKVQADPLSLQEEPQMGQVDPNRLPAAPDPVGIFLPLSTSILSI